MSSKPLKDNVEAVHYIYDHVKVKQQELYTYLVREGVDVWIAPGFPLPAIAHGTVGVF
jgi:nucleoside-specific outer membrane channel protein Tsx